MTLYLTHTVHQTLNNVVVHIDLLLDSLILKLPKVLSQE